MFNHKRSSPVLQRPSDPASPERRIKYLPIRNELTVVLVVGALSMSLLTSLLMMLVLAINNRALSHRERVYVQLNDGTTTLAQEYGELHRDPKLIQDTVVTWMQLTFEWDVRIPDSDVLDEGIQIGENKRNRVTTKAYLGGYLIEDGFRQQFLQELAASIIPRDVFSDKRRSVLVFYSVSAPRQIAPGRWEVDVTSTRKESTANQVIREVELNRTITVQAIDQPLPTFDEEEPLLWRKKVYELLMNRLVITDIVPLATQGQP